MDGLQSQLGRGEKTPDLKFIKGRVQNTKSFPDRKDERIKSPPQPPWSLPCLWQAAQLGSSINTQPLRTLKADSMGICSLWLFFPLFSFSVEASLWSKAGPRQKCGVCEARVYLLRAAVLWVPVVSHHRPQKSVPPVCQPRLAHTGLSASLPDTKASQYCVGQTQWSRCYRAICVGTGWLELGLFHKGPFRATTHLKSLRCRQMIMIMIWEQNALACRTGIGQDSYVAGMAWPYVALTELTDLSPNLKSSSF